MDPHILKFDAIQWSDSFLGERSPDTVWNTSLLVVNNIHTPNYLQ